MATAGGPAIKVSVQTGGARAGGPALPVAVVSDGRAVQGGPAVAGYIVTSGPVLGGPAIPVVAAAAGAPVVGGPAIPLYVVSGVLGATAPANTALPTISGTAASYQVLTATTGTWTNSPTSYSYQWNRNGSAIGGATASSYTTVSADAGTTITVTVTATNAAGATSATSAGVVLSSLSNAVAYWALEAAGGTDATGRGNDLSSSVGAPAYAAAKIANGFSGNGSSFIHRASTADLEIGTRDFEICCWINPSDLTGGNRRFLCKANTGNSYLLRIAADGTPQIICWSGTVLAQATKPAGTITIGSWFFVDVAFTSATKQWGVAINNGAFTNVATSTTTIDLTPTEPLTLGAGWGGGPGTGYWAGLIDEVGFWARNLTVAERTALYNGGAGRTWPFIGA